MRQNFKIVGQLLKKDFLKYRKNLKNNILDTALMIFTQLVIFAYIMPNYGLDRAFGAFFLIGAIGSFGFFDTVGKIYSFISDIEGDRTISYLLTMPARAGIILFYFALSWGLTSALTSLWLFPMGKILLWKQFDLTLISYPKLFIFYITAYLFYGVFSLWLAAIFNKLDNIQYLWVRIVMPLYTFGAFFYQWHTVYKISPLFGTINLINPIVYTMEGMRAAALGQNGYLPFWLCFFVLWGFIFVFGFWAVSKLKKTLDCV